MTYDQMTLDIATITDRRRGAYIVPRTGHWADWQEWDAIRCHGIHVGDASAETVLAELRIALSCYSDILADEDRPANDYDAAYHAARALSVCSQNGYFA